MPSPGIHFQALSRSRKAVVPKRLRVVIRNTIPNHTKFGNSVDKNSANAFLTCLQAPNDVLSVIFGIFGQFWFDIGGQIFEQNFFEVKKISIRKAKFYFWGIFSIFPVEPLVNWNIPIN